jgi:hypothetical protein
MVRGIQNVRFKKDILSIKDNFRITIYPVLKIGSLVPVASIHQVYPFNDKSHNIRLVNGCNLHYFIL